MRIRYNAKYSDISTDGSARRKEVRSIGSETFGVILKFVTGLVLIVWIGAVGYFLMYPILPSYQSLRSKIYDFDPYEIGYSATTQMLVSISPPDYTIEEDTVTVASSGGASRMSMEYVDPDSVELADLASKGTKIGIDAVNIYGNVVDGYTQESMMDGFWHYPHSSIPGKRGNTVVFGHRFHKLPPEQDTFFNLDDVSVGDKVVVTSDTGDLTYTVVKTHVVDKYDDEVLKQTGDYRITLITCTPLWTSDKRLVVVAIQDKVSSVI